MNKQIKKIIALCAVLVAMLGGIVAYQVFTKDNEGKGGNNSSQSSEPELIATQARGQGAVLVSDDESGTIPKSVDVKNEKGEFRIVLKSEPSKDGAEEVYAIEGYEDIAMDKTSLRSMANSIGNLSAKSLIAESSSELAKYGLDSPSAETEVTFQSGKKVKLFIGDVTPSEDAYYVRVDDSKDVYTVNASILNSFTKEVSYFVSRTMLAKPDDADMPTVNSLRVERKDIDYDILIEYDKSSEDEHSGGTTSSHKLIEPVENYLTIEKSTEIITGMFGLMASDIYAVKSTDEDMAATGLDDPFCKVTMSCNNGQKHELLLSEYFTDENNKKSCYGIIDGGKTIYIIPADSAKWVTVLPIDICYRMMIASYVWNITDLSASGGGESAEFVITPKNKDEKPSKPTSDDFNVKMNGKDFDTERYRLFYSFILSANAEEFALDAPVPTGEPMASIKFTDSYSGKTSTYDFYEDSMMRALIVVDGKSKYYCTKAYVNTLVENIKRIGTGEDYITNW